MAYEKKGSRATQTRNPPLIYMYIYIYHLQFAHNESVWFKITLIS